MNAKKTIQKILFILLWMTIGTGMLTLLVAAISKKNRDTCQDYQITINGKQSHFFFDEDDILQLLTAADNGTIKGRLISSINLRRLEKLLENNSWIKDAQLYFDNQDVLHVIVHERVPVARIFTTADNSFYLDGQACRMPLSDKMSVRVPVFTGFPEKKVLNEKDSTLIDQVKALALFISKDSFWMAQVAQVDITEQKTFEMIPTVGNHIIKFGDGNQIDRKFNRLFVFYKEILAKSGFDKYPVIDVQYAGQVVATRSGTAKTKVDTSQIRINVQRLLQKAKQMMNEKEVVEKNNIEKPIIIVDSSTAQLSGKPVNNEKRVPEINKPGKNRSLQPLKTTSVSGAEEKSETGKKEQQVPKAVMLKKEKQQ